MWSISAYHQNLRVINKVILQMKEVEGTRAEKIRILVRGGVRHVHLIFAKIFENNDETVTPKEKKKWGWGKHRLTIIASFNWKVFLGRSFLP